MRFNTGLATILALCAALPAGAGSLQLGTPSIQGDNVTFPVVIAGDVGNGVSAMDFTLNYDPNLLVPVNVVEGQAASAADKGVQFNILQPGQCKVVMVGLNQNAIPGGEVATVTMRRTSQTTTSAQVSVVDPTFSDPNATPIPSQGSSLPIDFGGGQPTPDDPAPENPQDPADGENDDFGEPGTQDPVDLDPNADPGANPVAVPGDTANPIPVPGTPSNPGTTTPGNVLAMPAVPGQAAPDATPGASRQLASSANPGSLANLPQGIKPGQTPAMEQPETTDAQGETPGETPGTPTERAEGDPSGQPTAIATLANPAGTPPGAALAVGELGPTSSTSPPAAAARGLSLLSLAIFVGILALILVMLFAVRRRLFS